MVPVREVKTMSGVEFDTLSGQGGGLDLRLSFSDVPPGAPPATEQRLDSVRDTLRAAVRNRCRRGFLPLRL